jgi:hypothetical protein
MERADEDWGSSGPACIFSIGVCIASGKDGIAYPIKTANLGGTTPADLAEGQLREAGGAARMADDESRRGRPLSDRSNDIEFFPPGAPRRTFI